MCLEVIASKVILTNDIRLGKSTNAGANVLLLFTPHVQLVNEVLKNDYEHVLVIMNRLIEL